MKKIILTLAFSFLIIGLLYAEIPVYCPKCKTLLYIYQKDEVPKGEKLKVKDFVSVSDSIPAIDKKFVCPLDGTKLNGWEYWGECQEFSSFKLGYQAVSLLTKDKDGNFIWVPFDIPKIDEADDE